MSKTIETIGLPSEGNPVRTQEVVYGTESFLGGWYPIATINSKGEETKLLYDSRYGKLIRSIDPMDAVTESYYDNFGRLAAEVGADETVTTVGYRESVLGAMEVGIRRRIGPTTMRWHGCQGQI